MLAKEAVGYAIVCGCTHMDVTKQVKEYINRPEGWEPTGGVTVFRDDNNDLCVMQALTRYSFTILGNRV